MRKTTLIIVSSVLLLLSISLYGLYTYIDGMSGGNIGKPKCSFELSDFSDTFFNNREQFFLMYPELKYTSKGYPADKYLSRVYFLLEEEGVAVGVTCIRTFQIYRFEKLVDDKNRFINPKSWRYTEKELCMLFEEKIVPKIELFFDELEN